MTCERCGCRWVFPHKGPQLIAASSPAKIIVYGGARGAGKSWLLQAKPFYMRGPDSDPSDPAGAFGDGRFSALVVREVKEAFRDTGGLWEEMLDLYGRFGARGNVNRLTLKFPSGAGVRLGGTHDMEQYRGNAYTYIGIEEGQQLRGEVMRFLLRCLRPSRGCPIPPQMVITCNPDPDSYLFLEMINWWIYPENHEKAGLPIPERAGVVRWFTFRDNDLVWIDEIHDGDPAEWRDEDGSPGTSITFVPGLLDDNPSLVEVDKSYRANLKSQTKAEQARDLQGNWLARRTDAYFSEAHVWWADPWDAPVCEHKLGYWDLAATERGTDNNPKLERRNATAGVLIGYHECPQCKGWRYTDWGVPCECNKRPDGTPYARVDDEVNQVPEKQLHVVVYDIIYGEWGPKEVMDQVRLAAVEWGKDVPIYIEEETASSGKFTTKAFADHLPEYEVFGDPPQGKKITRAEELARLAEFGLLIVVNQGQNRDLMKGALGAFPRQHLRDVIDATSGAIKVYGTHEWPQRWVAI